MNTLSVNFEGTRGGLILKVLLNFENKPWACIHSKVFCGLISGGEEILEILEIFLRGILGL